MKTIGLGVLGLLVLMLAGCVVSSVYPFYTQGDLISNPALIGTWADPEKTSTSKETWTFEEIAEQAYKLTTRDSNETNEFDAHLFTLAGERFIDCLLRQRSVYFTPTHVLMRVKSLSPQLELQLLDYEWLGKLVETNPQAIRHTITPNEAPDKKGEGQLILTADTKALQTFVRQHLDNTNAWSEPLRMNQR